MEKRLYLVANWKSHKKAKEAEEFLETYSIKSKNKVVVCPPMPYLFQLARKADEKGVKLGAQDLSNFPFGAYTGAVTAEMVKGVASYVIVGHSERRKYFGEKNEVIASKVRLAIDAEITPILCVDQPYMETQLAFFDRDELQKMVIAYEPLEAIGSGKPDSPDEAERVARRIIQLAQADVPVIYGGSVDSENVNLFVNKEHISGVLVGGASLGVDSWQSLVNKVS